MSLKAGRVGVNPADVDPINGHINPDSVDSYTKAQADSKFATIENTQPKTLALPINMLIGSQLTPITTVESAVQTMNNGMTNAALTDAVKRTEDYVVLEQNVTAAVNLVNVVGKVVNLYLDISSMPNDGVNDIIIGTIRKKPANTYVFFDVISKADPFNLITKGFIRNTGQMIIRGGNSAMAGITTCHIQVTYITVD